MAVLLALWKYRSLIGAGLAVAAVLGLWAVWVHRGHELATARALAVSEASEIKALKLQAKQTGATTSINTVAASDQAKIQATASTNLQKVNAYVPRKADAQCIVGLGAVRLLDASAHDQPVIPGPAVELPDADSGVALSELVSDDIVNAASYHQLARALKQWDDWYDAQAALWNAPAR